MFFPDHSQVRLFLELEVAVDTGDPALAIDGSHGALGHTLIHSHFESEDESPYHYVSTVDHHGNHHGSLVVFVHPTVHGS